MIKSIQLAVVTTLFLMIGCSGMQKGVGVVSYDKGTQPILASATAEGEYALYPSDGAEPKVSYFLHKGDPLGFKYGKTGEITAVGGSSDVALPDANYIWKRRDIATENASAPAAK